MVRTAGVERQRGISGAGQLRVCDDEPDLRDDQREAATVAGRREILFGVDRSCDRCDVTPSALEFTGGKRKRSAKASRREANLRSDALNLDLAGNLELFQNDLHWKDLVLFHEYFHGDTGSGVGASHQTGLTALITKLLTQSGEVREKKNELRSKSAAR